MTIHQASAFWIPAGPHRGRFLACVALSDPHYLGRLARGGARECPAGGVFHRAACLVAENLGRDDRPEYGNPDPGTAEFASMAKASWTEETSMSAEPAPTIGSLAPWFGAKRTLAPEIVSALGPHRAYWEPFCGPMAVLMAKRPAPFEVVNDLHGDLVNLARVVQDPGLGPALYRRLRRMPFAESFFRESRDRLAADLEVSAAPDVDRAFDYFVLSWQGMDGVSGTPMHHLHFASRFSSKGGAPGIRWSSAVRSIPAWRRRLERVMILSADAFDLLAKIEDLEGTAIYCDPPYLAKGAKYVHDFADADHARLAAALGRFQRARVVVSYYQHHRLADLYPGWRVERVDVAKSMVNSGMRDQAGATKAPEVLLSNDRRPSLS